MPAGDGGREQRIRDNSITISRAARADSRIDNDKGEGNKNANAEARPAERGDGPLRADRVAEKY